MANESATDHAAASLAARPDLGDVLLEDGRHRGEIEAGASQVRMRLGDLDRGVTLSRSDVGEGAVALPGNFAALARLAPRLMPVIAVNASTRASVTTAS